jgi:hypothetical protein
MLTLVLLFRASSVVNPLAKPLAWFLHFYIGVKHLDNMLTHIMSFNILSKHRISADNISAYIMNKDNMSKYIIFICKTN